ncbi:MAG: hypothetical protein HYZ28_17225 [Myxococcales bacterium]|nr:hypothetical protein [Myxococcales bacterium]
MSAPTEWRYGLSTTYRGIYLLRYLLFSSGLAVGFALLERQVLGSRPPLGGLAVGLLAGLVLFRGQLRPLRWPRVLLSRETLYVVHRRQTVALPWPALREVAQVGELVAIRLAQPIAAPSGEPAEEIRLEARKLGAAPDRLATALERLRTDSAARGGLPEDVAVRAVLSGERGPVSRY